MCVCVLVLDCNRESGCGIPLCAAATVDHKDTGAMGGDSLGPQAATPEDTLGSRELQGHLEDSHLDVGEYRVFLNWITTRPPSHLVF